MLPASGNDNTLSDCFLNGDEKSFLEIYERYWYRLFLSAYRRTKNKAIAEELVQELFLKLWQKRDALTIDQTEKYLFCAIRNATIDYLHKEMVAGKYQAYQKIYASMNANTTEELVELHDLEEALEKGLHTLSGKSEKVFRLYRMDHWPVDRIARHLNLSKKTVHYHLTRSQKFLRAYLKQYTLSLLVLLRLM